MSIPTFAMLLNQKIVVPSSSTAYFAVDRHFLYDCMVGYLSQIYVDEEWYLTVYPDVRSAMADGRVSGALDHFRRFGFYEHRMPYQLVVDEEWYQNAYPDIKAAIKAQHFRSSQDHFETVGYKEGRFPHENFALRLGEVG